MKCVTLLARLDGERSSAAANAARRLDAMCDAMSLDSWIHKTGLCSRPLKYKYLHVLKSSFSDAKLTTPYFNTLSNCVGQI